jgi:hypothetical protein
MSLDSEEDLKKLLDYCGGMEARRYFLPKHVQMDFGLRSGSIYLVGDLQRLAGLVR